MLPGRPWSPARGPCSGPLGAARDRARGVVRETAGPESTNVCSLFGRFGAARGSIGADHKANICSQFRSKAPVGPCNGRDPHSGPGVHSCPLRRSWANLGPCGATRAARGVARPWSPLAHQGRSGPPAPPGPPRGRPPCSRPPWGPWGPCSGPPLVAHQGAAYCSPCRWTRFQS